MTDHPIFQVVTANALTTGDVVYLSGCDEWSPDLAHAELIDDAGLADVRLSAAQRQDSLVVGPYLAKVALTDAGPRPVHFREVFRATGPSIPLPNTRVPLHAIAAE